MSGIRISKDYLFTFATEFTVLLAGVLVYKFAAGILGETGFSEYALSRRTMSFIHPVLILGLGVGIPRYLAFNTSNKERSGSYFISGLLILFIVTAFVLLLLNLFSQQFAYLMFGFEKYHYLIAPISVMLGGMVLHSACYSYFRGKMMMKPANLMQLLNIGIVPMAAFLFEDSISGILYITGIAWIVIAFAFLLWVVPQLQVNKALLLPCAKELLHYGVQRTPGDLGIAAFFALPAYITVHLTGNIIAGGHVAFGISLLNMAGAAFGPIGLMLLPQASKFIVEKNFAMLRSYSGKILRWTLLLTLAGLLIFELLAEQLIFLYLGEAFDELVFIVRITMIGCLGYTVYISLRSILDAYHVKAVNTRNIFISLLLFSCISLGLLMLYNNYMMVVYTFAVANIVLGALTVYETRKALRHAEMKQAG